MDIGHWIIPLAVFTGYVVAHMIKGMLHMRASGSFSFAHFAYATGGMPSGHGAAVSALTVSVWVVSGFGIALWIAGLFSLLAVRDAVGVRRSTGEQAQLLNTLTSKMKMDEKVQVVLGHTPMQMFAGLIIGTLAALLWAFGLGML